MRIIKLSIFFLLCGLRTCLYGQVPQNSKHNSLAMDSILKQGPEYDFINPLVGNWEVIQLIYAMDGEKVIARDTFKVRRRMIGNFLQEIMLPINGKEGDKFQRISYLNYNRTNGRWEYIVLDTRFPIMMYENSWDAQVGDNKIHLYLDNFVAPPFWGIEYAGLLTKQHRVIGFGEDENTNEQFWTFPGGEEFLAIKYIYKRK